MRRYGVVVVDDEPLARRTIWRLLAGQPDFEVVGEAADGPAALDVVAKSDPDVVFLDIRIPRLGGMEVARRLGGTRAPLVVIVTAFEEHALAAFDVHAVDYLLKPFDDARFDACLARVRTRLQTEDLAELHRRTLSVLGGLGTPAPVARSLDERVAFRAGDGIRFFDAERIDWVEARGYESVLHVGEEAHVVRESLTRLEGRLDAGRFVRIHRSAIVRVERILEIRPRGHGDYTVVLTDGTRLRLSRTRRAQVLALLGLGSDGG